METDRLYGSGNRPVQSPGIGGRPGRGVTTPRESEEERREAAFSTGNFDRNSDTYASDVRAWINREIYDDYKRRFEPQEQELISAITGPEMLDERLSAIHANTENAFEASRASANRRLARYGASRTDRLHRANATESSLGQASAVASAENSTRQHINDRNMAIISGGAMPRQAIEDF